MTSPHSQLQPGQHVSLKELQYGYEITLLSEGQPGRTVAAVGADYVVFADDAAGLKTRIPGHLIVAVLSAPPGALAQSA
jgi:hypothetical protein